MNVCKLVRVLLADFFMLFWRKLLIKNYLLRNKNYAGIIMMIELKFLISIYELCDIIQEEN